MSDPDHICRLYLLLPHDAGAESVEAFRIALDAGDVAGAALRGAPDGRADARLAERLLEIAARRDTAFLVENDAALAKAVGADGAHVSGGDAAYDAAREALGGGAIVGASCGLSRHAGLTLAEKGADYIAIEGDAPAREDMVSWWAEIVETPCVAWLPASLDEVGALARAGADFVAVDESLWRAADDPRDAVAALNLALSARRSAA